MKFLDLIEDYKILILIFGITLYIIFIYLDQKSKNNNENIIYKPYIPKKIYKLEKQLKKSIAENKLQLSQQNIEYEVDDSKIPDEELVQDSINENVSNSCNSGACNMDNSMTQYKLGDHMNNKYNTDNQLNSIVNMVENKQNPNNQAPDHDINNIVNDFQTGCNTLDQFDEYRSFETANFESNKIAT